MENTNFTFLILQNYNKTIRFLIWGVTDMVERGEVVMKHISTGSMVADPLTKLIARDVFQSHVGSMRLRRM